MTLGTDLSSNSMGALTSFRPAFLSFLALVSSLAGR